MALNTEQIGEYTVVELKVKELLPLMEGGTEGTEFQQVLLQNCVHTKEGKQIGKALDELGMSIYMKLVNAAMRVNGMDEGND